MQLVRLFAVTLVVFIGSACSSDPESDSDTTTSVGTDASTDAGTDVIPSSSTDTGEASDTDETAEDVAPDVQEVFAPYCGGTARTCDSLVDNGNLCILTTGCTFEDEACTGTPRACLLRSSLEECERGFGCFWSSLDQECEQITPLSCDIHDEEDCEEVGCDYEPADCTGTTRACSTYVEAIGCESQSGCDWIASPP